MNRRSLLIVFAGLASAPAFAAQYTGNVSILEVWKNGNVAFSLTTSVPTCNGPFILNTSDPGTKDQYAAVLAAKSRGTPSHQLLLLSE